MSVEMNRTDYRDLRMAIPEVCVVEDFLWPSWRHRAKLVYLTFSVEALDYRLLIDCNLLGPRGILYT